MKLFRHIQRISKIKMIKTPIPILLFFSIVLTLTSCDSKSTRAIKNHDQINGHLGQKSDSYEYGEIILDSTHTVKDSIKIYTTKTKESIDNSLNWDTDSIFETKSNMEYLDYYSNSIKKLLKDFTFKEDSLQKDLKTFDEITATPFGRNLLIQTYETYNLNSIRKSKLDQINSYKHDITIIEKLHQKCQHSLTQYSKLEKLEKNQALVEFYTVPINGVGRFTYSLQNQSGIYQVSSVKKQS